MAELNGTVKNSDDNSVGKILSSARKKKRLRYKKLSSELKIDEVYHAAAYKHVNFGEENPYSIIKNNIYATKTIVQFSIKKRVKKLRKRKDDKFVICFPKFKIQK